jgi:hypothetical protein
MESASTVSQTIDNINENEQFIQPMNVESTVSCLTESLIAHAVVGEFAWTCAGDPGTIHVKRINSGAFGEVHMVTFTFARGSKRYR